MEELTGRLERDISEVVRRELKTAAVSTAPSSSSQSIVVMEQNLKPTIQVGHKLWVGVRRNLVVSAPACRRLGAGSNFCPVTPR